MKKKITALVLAVSAMVSATAFADTINVSSGDGLEFSHPSDTKAVIMCYDQNGSLVYSGIYKSEDGNFKINVPSQYSSAKKKVYFIDTREFADIEVNESTPSPQSTPKPTDKPEATEKPSSSVSRFPSVYEREVDAIYAPAVVKDIETRVNNNNEDIYALTVLQHGEEKTVGIDAELAISTAPEEYSSIKGQTVSELRKGDVICLESNVSGDEIRTVDFIFRPTDEDIVTGTADYGTNFEKLFVSGGKVAGKWTFMKYGEKPSSDKYQYAFGIVGKRDGNTLTLINKEGSEDKWLDIDLQQDTIVYTCDVDAQEYELEAGTISDIRTTIPKSEFNKSVVDLNSDYGYNYALVRMVNKTATDIVLYNNYNN